MTKREDENEDEDIIEIEEIDMSAEEELELELASLEESNAQLERIAEKMAVEHAKIEAELAEAVAQDEIEAREELAQQIAEDEALKLQEAREAEETAEQSESDGTEEDSEDAASPILAVNENGDPDIQEMEACIETLLFLSEKPLSLNKLRESLGEQFEARHFREAIENLQNRYQAPHHGIELVEAAGGYQFRTKPSRVELARRLAKVQTQRLSRGAMETLAIISYRQPVLKEEIDKIRGVDSSHFIRTLMEKRMIRISGRSELPGRPILYSTTDEFLEIFGLADLSALPPLKELEEMVPSSESKRSDEDDPIIREMRKLVSKMNDERDNLSYDPREDEKLLREIRERVKSIATTTPTLEEQDREEEEEEPQETEAQPPEPLAESESGTKAELAPDSSM